MIKIRNEGGQVALHPSGRKQIDYTLPVETTGTITEQDISIEVNDKLADLEKTECLESSDIIEQADNSYTINIRALVDNSKQDVDIRVTVKNKAGETATETITIAKSLYS